MTCRSPLAVKTTLLWLGKSDVAFDAQGQMSGWSMQMIDLGPQIRDDPELSRLVDSYRRFLWPTPGAQ